MFSIEKDPLAINKTMITILIPSIGRESLRTVIKQITKYEGNCCKIVVIADGPDAFSHIMSKEIEQNKMVEVLRKEKNEGIAAAINFGLKNTLIESHFCIFSDDDNWVRSRKSVLNKYVDEKTDNKTIIVGLTHKKSKKKNKVISKLNMSPIEYTYKESYGFNKNYLSITSMIFPPEAAAQEFRLGFALREDLIWLQDLYTKGFAFQQVNEQLAVVTKNYKNTLLRENLLEMEKFRDYLNSETIIKLNSFTAFHSGRSAAHEGNLARFVQILSTYRNKSEKFTYKQKFAIALQISYLVFRKTLIFFCKFTKNYSQVS